MDTDPNPFRDSPDGDRSDSPTEAPADDTTDVTSDTGMTSDDDDDGASALTPEDDTPTSSQSDALATTGDTQAEESTVEDPGASGDIQPL
ncbi:MAG TPA: hypothetical protein VEY08_15105 [Chloroflexia bacterium]|nr:hypothetical protein [Chloroflexia bacterium]